MQQKENMKMQQGNFITNLKEFESQPGYYSAKQLHQSNTSRSNSAALPTALITPIISQLLTSGNYYVPSYMSLYGNNNDGNNNDGNNNDGNNNDGNNNDGNKDDKDDAESTTDEEEEEDKPKKTNNGKMSTVNENITITVTPIEKCSDKIIDENVYNTLLELANGMPPQSHNSTSSTSYNNNNNNNNNNRINSRKTKSTKRRKNKEKKKITKKYKKN
jgi:hypothetical protein